MKKILSLIIITALTFSSCKKSFLNEEGYGATNAIFNTEEGALTLVNTLYDRLRLNNLYGSQTFAYFSEMGTDMWLRGGNNTNIQLGEYRTLDATLGADANIWNHIYKGVYDANYFLEQSEKIQWSSDAIKTQAKGETLALKGFFLFQIVNIWGGVYLPTTTDYNQGLQAKRSSEEDFYKEIIKDLDQALLLVPASSPESGRITKPVVEALLARVHLFHKDWQDVITYSTNVITKYNYSLIPDWKSLINNGADRRQEFIWQVNFGLDKRYTRENENYTFVIYAPFIDQFTGIQTELGWTGYGGCQLYPTLYNLNLFNHDADARWKDGYQTVWYYNKPANKLPLQNIIHVDTALFFVPYALTTAQKNRATNRYLARDVNDLYSANGIAKDPKVFIGFKKFDDHNRGTPLSTNLVGEDYSVIRLADVMLMRAEAYMMLGHPEQGLPDIKAIRLRAAVPGYEAVMTNVTAADIDLNFILDERARELGGEDMRWFDLKRTGKLVERVKLYNPEAAPYIKDFHNLRPVPQAQFDGMPNPSTLGQNTGY
ncbi:RagB/SusD family nutrient uptake outer membrane protein [Mucilaginibacter sp. UYCu711]|uniref:RagB/SusD family nutrient uptake outer membrane protein n=1 Tax=Mucilaginibacter sp. UYCu711 TaxID=3156339 RepID=UPI003D214EB8